MQEHYFFEAHKEWDLARRKAFWSRILADVQGKDIGLLDFADIAHRLHLDNAVYQGTQTIPLDKIVGSEDRYHDFTRAFLPLNQELRERWSNIATLYLDPMSSGVPPIEVYKVGDSYFVKDGNHRVSVARQLAFEDIEAYVWEFTPPAGFGEPDADLKTLLCEAEHREFLAKTWLDELRPDHNLVLTQPCGYLDLLR
ncbi:MAG: hypothetical protein GYB65_13970, partial [Chloroflexi bacterium]|nr:hypothetical protein [Chloroflexota bacterium]